MIQPGSQSRQYVVAMVLRNTKVSAIPSFNGVGLSRMA